jgi:hypothetical protein
MLHRTILPLFALAVVVACNDNETPPPAHGAYTGTAPAALPCVPNLDGKIDSAELAPQFGTAATYLVSPPGKERTVDLAGQQRDGKLVWSLAIDFADDQVAKLSASKIDGKWYAGSFASVKNAIVTALDAGGRTEGIYTHDANAFSLHGYASAASEGPEKTLVVYTTPVALYRFPLSPGVAYTTVGEVRNATLRGLPYAGRDTYEVKVDGAGELGLPDFILTQALRVRTKVTIEPAAGTATIQRQTSFLFECLGEVARATSRLNEPEEGFTIASELRRLGLAP